jgi:transposase
VHCAAIQDRDGAKLVMDRLSPQKHPRLKLLWADGGYRGELVKWASEQNIEVSIVEKNPDQKTFQILPRRWVIERTFGWLMRCRRLCREYEVYPKNSENLIYLAMIHFMSQNLTRWQNLPC